MPQKVIKFTGINRKVNEFQNSGACEELINLRPDINGGHKVIRPKSAIRNNVQYDSVYEHTFGDTYNKIVVSNGTVMWLEDDGSQTVITGKYANNGVSVSYAGNVLIVYCEREKEQLVFKFEDGEYKSYDINIKPITDVEINYAYSSETLTASNSAVADDSTVESFNDALQKAASGFYSKFPNGLCGAAVIGCTYELKDGSELWSTAFIVANVTRYNGYSKPTIDNDSKMVVVNGASKVNLHLTFDNVDANELKRVNVYASRPILPFEVKKEVGASAYISDLSLNDIGLDGQVMYYQGSVDPSDPTAEFTLNFGKTQAGERIMDVTAGCIERSGESVSYNNRFHFYRSEVQHLIQIPTISDKGSARTSSQHWIAYVKFEDGWKLINKQYRFSETATNDFVYPMAGVKKMAFVEADWPASGDFSVPYSRMFYVDMKDSTAYNYSYAFDVTPVIERDEEMDFFHDEMEQKGQLWGQGFDERVLWKKEFNAINVSAQYNPYVFPVEYSYSFSGEIKDIATSYLPISSTQVGQYPLTVFTSVGVFALEQGDGSVLYSNILPLQPYVIDGHAVPTPYGTFFVSSRSLYLISGREAANVSYILNGEIEQNVKELDSYKALCCSSKNDLYDFSSILSIREFEDYISNATLNYDQLNNELLISSNDSDIQYSYVFNIDTKSYHKVAKKYLKSGSGSRYAIEMDNDSRRLVAMFEEKAGEQPILLESRPMSLEVLYTHMQRLLLLVDTKLSGNQYLMLSVFASDNLYDWKCIISSQKHDVALRHIRTNKAAKSYKDYVILINGVVDTNTDLSDLIADYTVVSRRLG